MSLFVDLRFSLSVEFFAIIVVLSPGGKLSVMGLSEIKRQVFKTILINTRNISFKCYLNFMFVLSLKIFLPLKKNDCGCCVFTKSGKQTTENKMFEKSMNNYIC